MKMEFGFLIYPIRATQALFSIIVLSVLSYASHSWTSHLNWTPSRISFLIFASAWTLLALLYLILVPRFSQAEIHRHGLLVIESLTTIFWFAGFVALAVFLGHGSCDGSWGPCRAAEAGDVFAAFEWALFSATTAITAMQWVGKGGAGARNQRPGPNVQYP